VLSVPWLWWKLTEKPKYPRLPVNGNLRQRLLPFRNLRQSPLPLYLRVVGGVVPITGDQGRQGAPLQSGAEGMNTGLSKAGPIVWDGDLTRPSSRVQ
jgi:hypothetical protein